LRMSLRRAKELGILKLRLPHWENKEDHIELTITERDGVRSFAPWVWLHSGMNVKMGFKNPHGMLITMFNLEKEEWQEYR